MIWSSLYGSTFPFLFFQRVAIVYPEPILHSASKASCNNTPNVRYMGYIIYLPWSWFHPTNSKPFLSCDVLFAITLHILTHIYHVTNVIFLSHLMLTIRVSCLLHAVKHKLQQCIRCKGKLYIALGWLAS